MHVTFPDGEFYDGELNEGKRNGRGAAKLPDGSSFVGEFKNDEYWNGKCNLKLPNGESYEGNISEGKMTGQGKYTWSHGSYFIGELRNGAPWTGTLHYEKGDLIIPRKNGVPDDNNNLPEEIEYKDGVAV